MLARLNTPQIPGQVETALQLTLVSMASRGVTRLVVRFEHEAEARRFWDAMRTRFEQFSLELHGEKTRLLEFGRYAIKRRQCSGQGKPLTFNSLGHVLPAHMLC